MKLKKLNRGAVVSVILILCVIGNIIMVSAQRKTWKQELIALTERYLSVAEQYVMLPEESREGGSISDRAYAAHLGTLKTELAKMFVDNDVVMREATASFEDCLQAQIDRERRIEECEIKMLRFDDGAPIVWDMSFVRDSAKLSVDIRARATFTSGNASNHDLGVVFNFQRVDDQWKLTYVGQEWSVLLDGRSGDLGGYYMA